jgi:predicted CoA-substrate-specific enzyme activase
MSLRIGIDVGADALKAVLLNQDGIVRELFVREVKGRPLARVREALQEAMEVTGQQAAIVGMTGSGAASACALLEIEAVDEPNALVTAFEALYPDVRTIIELGKQTQKYLLLERDEKTGRLLLADCNMGNKCAAGSGSFLDHMARRLNYPSLEAFARVALETENPAALSGRCGVFTESDIVHLYQKGTPRERIAAGVHQAICRTYRCAVGRARQFPQRVAFIGGVSRNPAVRKYLALELGLGEDQLFIPEHALLMSAIGAAFKAGQGIDLSQAIATLDQRLAAPIEYVGTGPLRFSESRVMSPPDRGALPRDIARAALGIDIGSVSTKAALIMEIDGQVRVLASYYRRTDGDPLAAVRDTVHKIQQQVEQEGFRIGQIVAATTGSGRYLTGDYVGADLIKNEITAQAHGALAFIADVESIFEIGGQDSKYVRLENGVITDFEMNKACAAGTGAFLEKQAANLSIPIEEFGRHAMQGARPPDLDWTCTVFSESALVYYQQNNVPADELCAGICLASGKNYLNKNVGSREVGKKVVFQGAVAFNQGMVAAFETILGRGIVVPPHPHLTGAIGAARLAYGLPTDRPRFRGFHEIAQGRYAVSSFECQGCDNRCDVNTFQMEGGPKYFYNDRCEKHSAVHKRNLGDGLPDLFEEREKMLFEVYQVEPPEDAPTVGIPRGMMFNEYFPLFSAFFSALGFRVVVSELTNKRIIRLGIEASIGEPCFPLKVAHGHVADLLEKGVDYLFVPAILNAEQPKARFPQTQTCPYVQAAPELFEAALHIDEKPVKYLSPRIFFARGRRHLLRVLAECALKMGKTAPEARAAFELAEQVQDEFRRRLAERGRQVIESLGPDQMAFVVVGRPYTLHDAAVNMQVGKKIRDLGFLAIPMDFLPIDEADVTDAWPHTYSCQVQRKLAAARLIKKDARLRAIVLTYFACGPDSFANTFFKDEIAGPCYVMQIDEHTADAGVITRLEAFADTTAAAAPATAPQPVRSHAAPLSSLNGRLLWIPYASEGARVLAASFRAYGINAEVLPRSQDPGLNLARSVISEDVCLPAFMTTEDILLRVRQPDFEPQREAFFQGTSEGPCRFGMYHMLQRRILDRMGLEDVDIITLGNVDHHGGLGTFFSMVAWDGFVTHDLLLKMLMRLRPYEAKPGTADAIFERCMQRLCDLMPEHAKMLESHRTKGLAGRHLDKFIDLLREAAAEFSAVERDDGDGRRPLVGLVGEFFVRIHDPSNQSIIRKLEQAGAEVWLAPATEFFAYSNRITGLLAWDRFRDTLSHRDLFEVWRRAFLHWLASRDEHQLFHACLPMLEGLDDIGATEVIGYGSRYVHPSFGGEAICSMGKSEDFALRGLDGIVSVIPFNCMPGTTVTVLSQVLRRRHENIPFLNMDYDGFIDSSRDVKITAFMSQVRGRFLSRKP